MSHRLCGATIELKVAEVGVRVEAAQIPREQAHGERCGAAAIVLHSLFEEQLAEEQLAFLKDRECDAWQGYLCSKPVPAEEFEARFLRS